METPAALGGANCPKAAAVEKASRDSDRMGYRVSSTVKSAQAMCAESKGAYMRFLILAVAVGSVALAQSEAQHRATYIMDEDVKEVLKGAPPKVDQQLKVVDLGKYNLAVGIVHRG